MRNKDCGKIMEEIERGYGIPEDKNVLAHIRDCPDCFAYLQVTKNIISLGKTEEKIDLWNEFRKMPGTKKRRGAWIVPAFASLSFCLILAFFTFFNNSRSPAVNEANSLTGMSGAAAQQDPGDSVELDCYYEISMDY